MSENKYLENWIIVYILKYWGSSWFSLTLFGFKNQELTWFSHRSIKNQNQWFLKKSENFPTLVWTYLFLMCMMAFSVFPSILLESPTMLPIAPNIYIQISLNMLPSAQIKRLFYFSFYDIPPDAPLVLPDISVIPQHASWHPCCPPKKRCLTTYLL